jgi:hypothetical protein
MTHPRMFRFGVQHAKAASGDEWTGFAFDAAAPSIAELARA